jgi:hypothetical protein
MFVKIMKLSKNTHIYMTATVPGSGSYLGDCSFVLILDFLIDDTMIVGLLNEESRL